MKPSKRIYEIKQMREKGQRVPSDLIYQMYINAILEFLDEEWEKNQPCKHEFDEKGFCKNCHGLFAI